MVLIARAEKSKRGLDPIVGSKNDSSFVAVGDWGDWCLFLLFGCDEFGLDDDGVGSHCNVAIKMDTEITSK